MNTSGLDAVLSQLLSNWESETVEFKRGSRDYETHEIGKYFSALSNEANLRNTGCAWLVLGVDDKTRAVIGTDYRVDPQKLHSLKLQIASDTEPSITVREIHELVTLQGRVVLLEIPAAPRGIPISWKGHYYARAGESLISLGLDKQDEIRQQTLLSDWSAQLIADATLEHLDNTAIQKARESFSEKYANRFSESEVMSWPLQTFLHRARLTRNGKITRATLLLLGKAESAHFLSPHPAEITWKLEGAERAYEHFSPPFLLTTSMLYQKIRNIQVRILPEESLLAVEVAKYDRKIVLEALHNCIAHQDYTRDGRIIVTERLDRLAFENEGNFFEGSPDDYNTGHKTPRRYRNPFLAQAMTKLNMIDTMGYGIYEMYAGQARRYFPMPDYDLSESGVVRLTIYGSIVDLAYSRMLMQKTSLPLEDVLALDRIQKGLSLPDEMIKHLRSEGLIEGRKPHFTVSAVIAKATSTQTEYILKRNQDDSFYERLLEEYLLKFNEATRKDIDALLFSKLGDAFTTEQKSKKVANLLTKMRRKGRVKNTGSDRAPLWQLAEKIAEKKQ